MVDGHRSFRKPSEKVECCRKKYDWDAVGDAIIETRYYGDSHPAVVCERPKGICENWDAYTRRTPRHYSNNLN